MKRSSVNYTLHSFRKAHCVTVFDFPQKVVYRILCTQKFEQLIRILKHVAIEAYSKHQKVACG